MTKLIIGIILFLGILVAVIPYPFNQRDLKICRKPNGFFPKPGSLCNSYYQCKRWIPSEKTCPKNHHFFPSRNMCVLKNLFPCFEEPSKKECIRPNGNFLKPGTKCKTYFQCCNGIPTEKSCPFGKLFDPDEEKCERSEIYTCVEDITSPTVGPITTYKTFEPTEMSSPTTEQQLSTTNAQTTTTDATTSSNVATETNPSTKEEIQSSTKLTTVTDAITAEPSSVNPTEEIETTLATTESEIQTTSLTTERETEITSPTTERETETTSQTTERETETNSQTTETTEAEKTEPASTKIVTPSTETDNLTTEDPVKPTTKPWDESDLECPELNGYFPHPYDKRKFINCNNGYLTVFTCPSNLIYDHQKRACAYPK